MTTNSPKTSKSGTARTSRAKLRPRLIDACLSALHLYGPSKTTVDKVVALAGLSPGIVRFYFESKDAMLLATLEFLANEFEEQLISPVAAQIDDPVAALDLLVERYLGSDLASARKVSVWYSFWGEASSRPEYFEIYGSCDSRFEALIQDLARRLLQREPSSRADATAIALGLQGTLEVLWQGFAFQSERAIDRLAARHRVDAYLRSVFPSSFRNPSRAALPSPADCVPWLFAGLACEYPATGMASVLSAGLQRFITVRVDDGSFRAIRNACPVLGHALLEACSPRPLTAIECRPHGLSYDALGRAVGHDHPPLSGRACLVTAGAVWIPSTLESLPTDLAVGPVVNGLSSGMPHVETRSVRCGWDAIVRVLRGSPLTSASGWTANHFRQLVGREGMEPHWMAADHQLLMADGSGLTVINAVPAPGDTSTLRISRYDRPMEPRRATALGYLARRHLRRCLSLCPTVTLDGHGPA